MGQGLGKNSPIVLSLGKESYEAMIERHGQYVRWRVAKKCPCVCNGGQPDIHCPFCAGSGDVYSYAHSFVASVRKPVFDSVIELEEELEDVDIIKVLNYKGVVYPFVKEANYIKIDDGEYPLVRGDSVDVVFSKSLVETEALVKARRICKGFYSFDSLSVDASNSIEGVYYKVPYDVVKVEALNTLDGVACNVKVFYKNCVEIEEWEEDPPLIVGFGVAYVKPLKFVVLSQNFNSESLFLVQKHNGEAMCTFPYMYDVAENDLITVLTGHMTNKVVMKKGLGDDVICEYFVESIISLETIEREYKEGLDFVLVGTNCIHWIKDECPELGDNMSITYRYNPTYRVCQSLANLRTSENQRLPRKAVLKQFSTFQDARGVHFND